MWKLEFTKDLETGIKAIDDQHRRLFACAQAVFSLGDKPSDEVMALRAARFLIAYVSYHFQAEEVAMMSLGFSETKRHHDQHASLREQVSDLRQKVEDVAPFRVVAAGLHVVLEDWVRQHVTVSDKAFARYCAGLKDRPAAVTLPSPSQLLRAGALSRADYDAARVVHAGSSKPASSDELRARMLVM